MPRTPKKLVDQQRKWEKRIAEAKKVKRNWRDLFRVTMALEYLDGKQMPPGYNAQDWITINNVYSHLKAQLPALYSADPYFYVKLRRSYMPDKQYIEMLEKRGKIRAAYLNYLKDELDLKNHVRLCIQDAMFAFGVMRIEHHSTIVANPDSGKPIKGDDGNDILDESGFPLLEPEYIPVNSRYRVARVHFDDFLFDPNAGPLEDSWAWVAERVRTTIGEVKRNPLFKSSAVKSLLKTLSSPAVVDQDEQEREERQKGDITIERGPNEEYTYGVDDDRPVVLWKIFDLRNSKWVVIAEGADEPLLPEQEPPAGVERHCYAILRFTLRDNSPYPIPPMSQGIDVSKEYNIARSDLLRHRRRFNRKYTAFIPGLANEDELAKLEVGEDGAIIKTVQPGEVVLPIADAPLDQMRYQEIMALKRDMAELFGGVSDEARGIASADSATQAGILDARLQMKEGDALSMVVDFVRVIARKLDQLVSVHMDREEVVRITGLQGDYVEIVRPEDYQSVMGEYSYEVNVGATMPRLPQMERASWIAFLQLLGNVPPLMTSPRLLKKMAELHHIEDELLVEELVAIGRKMVAAQAEPAKTGSLPNVGEDRPVSAVGGQPGGAAAQQNLLGA